MATRIDSLIAHKNKFDVVRVLKSVPLLAGITSSERSLLSKGLTKLEFKKDAYIMREGEEGDTFYIIISGTVSVVVGSKEEKIGTLTSGDYCGEQALLQNSTRNASLKCISDTVQCFVCKQDIFRNILEKNSSVQFAERHAQRNALVDIAHESKVDAAEDEQKTADHSEKTTQTIDWMLGCINNNMLFKNYSKQEKCEIFKYMRLVNVSFNEYVITQGESGETASQFYIVNNGEYDTYIDGVKQPQCTYTRGGWFGELALLYNSPRAASIKCITEKGGQLYVIKRKYFKLALKNLQKRAMKENVKFLKSVDLFKSLLFKELLYLNEELKVEKFESKSGTVIYNEGDNNANGFYVIKKGSVKWVKKTGESGVLNAKQFFGERALRTKNPRAATIEINTNEETVLLSISVKTFEELLGQQCIQQMIDNKISEYKESETDMDMTAAPLEDNSSANAGEYCELKEFKTIGLLGRGGFGLVTLVQDSKSGKTYALKAIKKYQVIENNLQQHIISEKLVMQVMDSQFLVNLHCTYKDKLRVYFLLDVCLGGELFTILRKRRYFNEKTAKFYTASVIEGFDYMHSKNIIYRDLKPENLVLDSKGYLKIADFGFAKKINPNTKTFTFCGTPDYLCPEIITQQGHGKGVDWWCLGILIYEMLASFAPFMADKPMQTYRKILKGKIRYPKFFTKPVKDLITKLLQHKPTKRYGVLKGGANKIRKHVWFKTFEWDKLYDQTMKPPIVNKIKSAKDLSNFNQQSITDDYAKPIDPRDEFDELF